MSTEIFRIPLGFDNCWVLRGNGVVVIDAGQPNRLSAFQRGLQRAGVRENEINLILLTHAHWDHMGSAAAIKEYTGAPLAVHENEVDWVVSGHAPLPSGLTAWGKFLMRFHHLFTPLIDVPTTEVEIQLTGAPLPLSEFGVSGSVLHTPGHSPGSVSVVLDTGEAFVGDLAMNRFPLTLKPSLSILGDDRRSVNESWRKVLHQGARMIYPAHGSPFAVSEIPRHVGPSG
jgi:glyoxylase-like metal-dependent hydrolase (beta-lactamase superfamily II)